MILFMILVLLYMLEIGKLLLMDLVKVVRFGIMFSCLVVKKVLVWLGLWCR